MHHLLKKRKKNHLVYDDVSLGDSPENYDSDSDSDYDLDCVVHDDDDGVCADETNRLQTVLEMVDDAGSLFLSFCCTLVHSLNVVA
mmetsp:Transcript_26413/g.40537  ORF Transcript_26413/g.40537 Transcript_26413/m.40537 type:complete len:86 (+) Transcript_26413:842-1099(+)